MLTRYYPFALLTAGMFMFQSCEKEKKPVNNSEDQAAAADLAASEQFYDDAWNISGQAVSTGSVAGLKMSGNAQILNGCATVTRDTVSVPHTATIDFGPTNCLCSDGRYRRGQIVVSWQGAFLDSGHVHTIGFNNYYVNDHQVTGTKTVTNTGNNSAGQMQIGIAVNGAIILPANGGTRSINYNRVRTWVNGQNTPVRHDDAFEITGSGTMTRPNGSSYSSTITSPLLRSFNCQWIRGGVIQITNTATNTTRTLDYGNGSCDDQAVLTVNGTSTPITLP